MSKAIGYMFTEVTFCALGLMGLYWTIPHFANSTAAWYHWLIIMMSIRIISYRAGTRSK